MTTAEGDKTVMYHRHGTSNKKSVRSLKPFASAGKRMSFVGRRNENNVSNHVVNIELTFS